MRRRLTKKRRKDKSIQTIKHILDTSQIEQIIQNGMWKWT